MKHQSNRKNIPESKSGPNISSQTHEEAFANAIRSGGRQESHYRLIKPLVYAEELLEEPGVKQLFDYKFMCCDHEIKFIFFASERGVADTGSKFSAYSTDWKKLDYMRGPEASTKDYPCPPQAEIQEMITIAQTIAQKFEHVRVDLYDIKGKIYIGELTFTLEGGIMDYFTNEGVEAAGHKDRK